MAEANVENTAGTDGAGTVEGELSGAEVLAKSMTDIAASVGTMTEKLSEVEKRLEVAEQVQYPHGQLNGAPGIRKGEDSLSSRSYSMGRLARALRKRADKHDDWDKDAKVEIDLGKRLSDAYNASFGFPGGGLLCPLGSDLMPLGDTELVDGTKCEGISKSLVQECRDVMYASLTGLDMSEFEFISKRLGQSFDHLKKDLSANIATTGGTLVGLPSQGELIELLRAMELWSRVGAQEIDLPPQGSIRFPRVTSGVTIGSYAEGATVTESTPGTSSLELNAKAYSGLVDIPDELMRFATSVAVEAWLRSEFLRDLQLQTDSDMIAGAGGTSIQGVINYSGFRTVTASTTGANGDTLDPEDPGRLYADIADQNAPVDRGFFYAMTNTLWDGLIHRKATTNEFIHSVGVNQVGGPTVSKSLNGHQVACTTQIPTNRSKGSGTDLTLLLAGVGAEWYIARAGVVDFRLTDSDASKFQTRTSTLRGDMYCDAGPRHENSFGMIDTLLNQ